MSKKRIWLIRHGQSEANAKRPDYNWKNIDLTELGKRQAEQSAQLINQKPDKIIVSPLMRAQNSLLPIRKRWSEVPIEIWPIEEFIYLSPEKYQKMSSEEQINTKKKYWENLDPNYCDGVDAESFASFIQRINQFYNDLCRQDGFTVVVGHGQFFKAFLLAINNGFNPSKEFMSLFRYEETTRPIQNGEIIKLAFDRGNLHVITE